MTTEDTTGEITLAKEAPFFSVMCVLYPNILSLISQFFSFRATAR